MPVVAKAAEEMLQMMCSVKHWGTCSMPDSSNLDYYVHAQFGKDLVLSSQKPRMDLIFQTVNFKE